MTNEPETRGPGGPDSADSDGSGGERRVFRRRISGERGITVDRRSGVERRSDPDDDTGEPPNEERRESEPRRSPPDRRSGDRRDRR